MILVAVVLVVFEGRLVVTMITHRSSMKSTTVTDSTAAAAVQDGTLQTQASSAAATQNGDTVLAGLPTVKASSAAAAATPETQAETHATTSDPSSSAIVPKAATPVDDSYFKDAAFIGDSRMQGFQNASGITQGTFFTSVGMSLSAMQSEAVIRTTEGNITVAAALSGNKYNKVYIMLGQMTLANTTGIHSTMALHHACSGFRKFAGCDFLHLQRHLCGGIQSRRRCPVNNTNVDKINSIFAPDMRRAGLPLP